MVYHIISCLSMDVAIIQMVYVCARKCCITINVFTGLHNVDHRHNPYSLPMKHSHMHGERLWNLLQQGHDPSIRKEGFVYPLPMNIEVNVDIVR